MKSTQETACNITPELNHFQTPSKNLTTSEAAQYLNVQPSTLEQWRWNGRGPKFVKISRSVRYRLIDLEAFLEARIFCSTTEAQAKTAGKEGVR